MIVHPCSEFTSIPWSDLKACLPPSQTLPPESMYRSKLKHHCLQQCSRLYFSFDFGINCCHHHATLQFQSSFREHHLKLSQLPVHANFVDSFHNLTDLRSQWPSRSGISSILFLGANYLPSCSLRHSPGSSRSQRLDSHCDHICKRSKQSYSHRVSTAAFTEVFTFSMAAR